MCLLLVIVKVILATPRPDSNWESISHIYDTYNEKPGLDHYLVYGHPYDVNIQHLRWKAIGEGRKVKMLEIGVQSGGSTRVWKRYFRNLTDYTGLDIDPRCTMFQSPTEGIKIVTGSQLDTALLLSLCKQYGPFDLVVDDGGHQNKMMQVSLKSLWNCMEDDGVYVIEDLHALNMGITYIKPGAASIFHEIADWMKVRSPALKWTEQEAVKTQPAGHLKNLAFYDSIMFLHYGSNVPGLTKSRVLKGDHWLKGNWKGKTIPKPEVLLSDWCKECCIGCYDN